MDTASMQGLGAPATKDQLRFLTCGSVDDGKSTLIGRLLHDSKMIYEDQFEVRDQHRLATAAQFIEVFVDTPIAECARRDPKGLYLKARSGKIKNFTGLDVPYEAPTRPEMHLQTLARGGAPGRS